MDFIDLLATMCGVFFVAFVAFTQLFKLKKK
jgi:hypothetical protein